MNVNMYSYPPGSLCIFFILFLYIPVPVETGISILFIIYILIFELFLLPDFFSIFFPTPNPISHLLLFIVVMHVAVFVVVNRHRVSRFHSFWYRDMYLATIGKVHIYFVARMRPFWDRNTD